MSSSTATPPQMVSALTQKLNDPDPDIRYMSLSDLNTIFTSTNGNFISNDVNACNRLVDGFLMTLDDTNGEVQNLAIKCLGPFVVKAHPDVLPSLVRKLSQIKLDSSVDASMSALALRQIVVSLPRPTTASKRLKHVQDAYALVSNEIVPRLIGGSDKPDGLIEIDLGRGADGNNIDILTEIAHCFGPMLQPDELMAMQKAASSILDSQRAQSGLKKKAVTAIAALAPYLNDSLLSSFISTVIEKLRDPHMTPADHRQYLTLLGLLAKGCSKQFGPHLTTLAPFVLAPLQAEPIGPSDADSDDDEYSNQLDDVREAALISLEYFMNFCGDDMSRYHDDTLDAVLLNLKYDPNYAGDDEEGELDTAEDEEDLDLDEDFVEEGDAYDEDDLSWRVRKSSAKALQTIIKSRSKDILDNSLAYNRMATALIHRFSEREETVRLEVISTLALLIRQTMDRVEVETSHHHMLHANVVLPTTSRKRRRRESDISMSDHSKLRRLTGSQSPESLTPPPGGAPASLEKVSHDIAAGLVKIIQGGSLSTKQASIVALKDLVVARSGGLQELLNSTFKGLVDNLRQSTTESRSSTFTGAVNSATVAIASLQLISEICKFHTSVALTPYLRDTVGSVAKATQSSNDRVACEALKTSEHLLKVLTPPRNASTSQKAEDRINELLGAIISTLTSKASDAAVRAEAVRVVAVLLGRTSTAKGTKLIDSEQRNRCFSTIYETLKNETIRLAAVTSIEAMASTIPDASALDPTWLADVCLELGAHLRKADRTLRTACLQTLRVLLCDKNGFDSTTEASAREIVPLVVYALNSGELTMISPALNILSSLADSGKSFLLDDDFYQSVVLLIRSPNASAVVDQLCTLVHSLGRQQNGQVIMKALLKDVGVSGRAAVVGKVIGNLLVSSKGSLEVKVDDFLKELETQQDERRKSLALCVLGEYTMLSGDKAGLKPELFTSYFKDTGNKISIDAAVALGRSAAGPGNAKLFVPAILSREEKSPEDRYLALHSVRELLQSHENAVELEPFLPDLWSTSVTATQLQNSREIGAECVANLAIIDPKAYLPKLQNLLADASDSSRAVGTLALRDVYTIADLTYDKYLRPITIDIITKIMRDSNLDNRRLALNTFNAAARNKPSLVLPQMGQLLPLVLDQTLEDPSLIREVTMGPFKHRVDDGLECRKSAYETLYSLVEIAPSRLDLPRILDRVVVGITDEQNIRSLCNLMIAKFSVMLPAELERRLEELVDRFRTVLAVKVKENAVRHEHERAEDAKRAVIKTSLELNLAYPANSNPRWLGYLEDIKKEHKRLVDDIERDVKDVASKMS